MELPPNKSLHWPPGVIVTCLAFEARHAPITGASELNRYPSERGSRMVKQLMRPLDYFVKVCFRHCWPLDEEFALHRFLMLGT